MDKQRLIGRLLLCESSPSPSANNEAVGVIQRACELLCIPFEDTVAALHGDRNTVDILDVCKRELRADVENNVMAWIACKPCESTASAYGSIASALCSAFDAKREAMYSVVSPGSLAMFLSSEVVPNCHTCACDGRLVTLPCFLFEKFGTEDVTFLDFASGINLAAGLESLVFRGEAVIKALRMILGELVEVFDVRRITRNMLAVACCLIRDTLLASVPSEPPIDPQLLAERVTDRPFACCIDQILSNMNATTHMMNRHVIQALRRPPTLPVHSLDQSVQSAVSGSPFVSEDDVCKVLSELSPVLPRSIAEISAAVVQLNAAGAAGCATPVWNTPRYGAASQPPSAGTATIAEVDMDLHARGSSGLSGSTTTTLVADSSTSLERLVEAYYLSKSLLEIAEQEGLEMAEDVTLVTGTGTAEKDLRQTYRKNFPELPLGCIAEWRAAYQDATGLARGLFQYTLEDHQKTLGGKLISGLKAYGFQHALALIRAEEDELFKMVDSEPRVLSETDKARLARFRNEWNILHPADSAL